MHIRNGGTSMASPVVAGIAALYLERCGQATYQDFIDDIHATAYTDQFTGVVPNNDYGYGKIHALNALLQKTPPAAPTVTSDWGTSLSSSTSTGYQWFLDGSVLAGETSQDLFVTPPYGSYQVQIVDANGCTAWSTPFVLTLNLNENENDEIFAYPNPSNSLINISVDAPIYDVNVIGMDGTQIRLTQINDGTYSLENVANGMYTMSVRTEKGIYFSKIIRL